MTNDQFMKFVKKKAKKQYRTLNSKGSEYSKENNRFHNFEISKKLYDLIDKKDTEYFVFYANFCKQFTGIIDILNGKEYTIEMLTEKFGDSANYLLLLEARLNEAKQKEIRKERFENIVFDLAEARNFGDISLENISTTFAYKNDINQFIIKKHQVWESKTSGKYIEVSLYDADADLICYNYSGSKKEYYLNKAGFINKFRYVKNATN